VSMSPSHVRSAIASTVLYPLPLKKLTKLPSNLPKIILSQQSSYA